MWWHIDEESFIVSLDWLSMPQPDVGLRRRRFDFRRASVWWVSDQSHSHCRIQKCSIVLCWSYLIVPKSTSKTRTANRVDVIVFETQCFQCLWCEHFLAMITRRWQMIIVPHYGAASQQYVRHQHQGFHIHRGLDWVSVYRETRVVCRYSHESIFIVLRLFAIVLARSV